MKYTPGPWEVRIKCRSDGEKYCDGIYTANEERIVETDSGYYHPPELADAYLIASAPLMYEALLAVCNKPGPEAVGLIHRALAAAEGRCEAK